MGYLYLKATHIIFVVTWFAGLFYIVRLFIYQREAMDKPRDEAEILAKQLNLMASRLWYIITWPSAVITLILGLSLIFHPPVNYYQQMPAWLWWKLILVGLLLLYHLYCHRLFLKFQKGEKAMNSQGLRLWNELATLFLVAIVFLVVVKSALNMLYGLLALVLIGLLLMIGIKLYKKYRKV